MHKTVGSTRPLGESTNAHACLIDLLELLSQFSSPFPSDSPGRLYLFHGETQFHTSRSDLIEYCSCTGKPVGKRRLLPTRHIRPQLEAPRPDSIHLAQVWRPGDHAATWYRFPPSGSGRAWRGPGRLQLPGPRFRRTASTRRSGSPQGHTGSPGNRGMAGSVIVVAGSAARGGALLGALPRRLTGGTGEHGAFGRRRRRSARCTWAVSSSIGCGACGSNSSASQTHMSHTTPNAGLRARMVRNCRSFVTAQESMQRAKCHFDVPSTIDHKCTTTPSFQRNDKYGCCEQLDSPFDLRRHMLARKSGTCGALHAGHTAHLDQLSLISSHAQAAQHLEGLARQLPCRVVHDPLGFADHTGPIPDTHQYATPPGTATRCPTKSTSPVLLSRHDANSTGASPASEACSASQ